MKNILLIPRIRIHNANALSSPYTIGFPAMTAWMGATHALQRKLQQPQFEGIRFKSMAVVCHDMDLQTYRGHGDYVYSIIGTGNPLDKTGTRPSFIEEARCHLSVSLIIEFIEDEEFDDDEFKNAVAALIMGKMKFAGGDVLKSGVPELHYLDNQENTRKMLRRVMPGFCLIERRDLMKQSMEEGLDGIDAMLDYLKVTSSSETDEQGNTVWKSSRKEPGWIVPIATGFSGITELGQALNQRDPNTPHRFAESVVTLGEFIMPYRIDDLENMLWHYHADPENNLYLCQQNKPMVKEGE